MNYRIMFLTMAGMMAISNLSHSSPIDDDYQTGDRLTAGMLQNIRDAVNDNDMRVAALEGGAQEIAVDCSMNANAFADTTIEDDTTYTLTGMCDGPIWIESRRNVKIQGDATGSKDDGVQLQAGLTEHPYAAIGIWQSHGVVLDNLTVSAANYVNSSYSFGDNVSAVHVGNKSLAEASNVDFIGGDYSVHVYQDGMLRLKEGNTVTDFNLGGLTAYNLGLIVTLDDITVTGLVGASTSEFSTAVMATNNAVIDIRGGGSFAGPTFSAPQDYRATIRAADNGTVRVQDADPTLVTGGIEASRSAVIWIEGNTTVNGYIGAYHQAYLRVVDVTQFGGQLEAGDDGYLRIDDSSLTLSNSLSPATSIDIYRMGKVRIGNTTIDPGPGDIDINNFGMLNLRGSTNAGGVDINCHESRLVLVGGIAGINSIGC